MLAADASPYDVLWLSLRRAMMLAGRVARKALRGLIIDERVGEAQQLPGEKVGLT